MRNPPLLVRVAAFVTAAALTVAAPAQSRRAAAGRVLDADGQPAANATVTLATPRAANLAVAAPDVLTATTDGSGRFRVDALLGRGYAGGACVVRADGSVAASALAQEVAAGAFVTLRLAAPLPALRLRVGGLAAWGDDAPRRARVVLQQAPGLQAELALDANGEVPLPPLPSAPLLLELLGARGDTIAAVENVAVSAGAGGMLEVAMPPPRALRVRVRDDAGKPVGGAVVRERTVSVAHRRADAFAQCTRERWRELGTTDADGVLATRVARSTDWVHAVSARALGTGTGVGALFFGAVDGAPAEQAGGGERPLELDLEVAAARPLTGRVLRTQTEPLAATPLWVEVTSMVALQGGGSVHVPLLFPVTTGADGAWQVEQVPADFALPRLLAPPSLPCPDGVQLPPILVEAAGRVATLGPVVLASMPALELRVLTADGGPAENAVAVLVPTTRRRWSVEAWDARYRVDRAGTARLRVPRGPALLFCTDGEGFAEHALDETTSRAELRLAPLSRSTLRARTPGGEPAAGAVLSLTSYSPAIDEPDPLRQARGAVAVSLHAGWLDGLVADADGRFAMRVVPGSGVPLELAIDHASGTLAQLRLTGGDREVQLVGR